MKVLRTISKILILIPVAMLIYDLVNEWFVNARFKIQTFQEWLTMMDASWTPAVRTHLKGFLGGVQTEQVMQAPGPLVLAVLPVVLYLIYWIWFKANGGQRAGKFTFKSHD